MNFHTQNVGNVPTNSNLLANTIEKDCQLAFMDINNAAFNLGFARVL